MLTGEQILNSVRASLVAQLLDDTITDKRQTIEQLAQIDNIKPSFSTQVIPSNQIISGGTS